jgi:hypothetical protein
MHRLRVRPVLFAAAFVSVGLWSAAASAQVFSVPFYRPNVKVRIGVCPIRAQTSYIPYYGKNRVRYKPFEWHIYKTDRFDFYFYPELLPHLERVAGYAESAYDRISGELKHDLADRVPIILFKTQSDFQLENISGAELPEGVLAFAEPERNRMVLPIDEPDDQLYRLITHELTHVFEFDIIPRGIIGGNLPLWMDEGLANYMAGYWNVLDLMQVRDAAITDNVPKMSEFESQPLSGRLPYSIGHATFEFIESKWGKEGLRQFLFSLRRSAIGGGDSAYEEALKLQPAEFDEQFDRYLKERFKPFRDKERPADYGRNIAPRPDRSVFVRTLSIEASPTGDMLAAVVGNRRDQELDIVLLSARDGQVITNLTKGLDIKRGFEYIATAGGLRGNLVPWISWAPVEDRLAYFVRTERDKTLIIHNHVTGRVERRLQLRDVDAPESPAFSPDARKVAFSALQNGVTDIFIADLDTGAVTNVTRDAVADYAPTFAPDGRTVVYAARVGGNDKLFHVDVASGQRKQLTFGTHDDTSPKFVDDHRIVFTSTAVDPAALLAPEVAKNGNIPNIWSLDITTGELRQLTDAVAGNVSPVVVRDGTTLRIGFVSYYKGENSLHIIPGEKPVAVAQASDYGSPGPTIPFQPPLAHTLLRDNIRKKGRFEKMTLAGRPPVNLGVTTGGNFYGNTQITFTDVLGDKQMSFYAESFQQYRTTAFTYVNIEHRLQYALQGFANDQFFFGQYADYLYDPSLAPYIDRDLAEAVATQRGGTAFLIYPFSRYTRTEAFGGYIYMNERYNNQALQQLAAEYQEQLYGAPVFRNGHMVPLGVALVRETTVFREYGPVAGSTVRVAVDSSPSFGDNWISRRTLDIDARRYFRLAANGVFAVRFRGLQSWGRNPDFLRFGGNSEMRGYDYLQFLGHRAFFANAELRFPLIEAMLTPIGVLGGLRGVFYVNIGGAGFNGLPFTFMAKSREVYTPVVGFEIVDLLGGFAPVYGPPTVVDGIRLVDGRASYGIGLESFILGFPMHFDWSWKTLFNRHWEDALFAAYGGSSAFRRMKFAFWIGYDF